MFKIGIGHIKAELSSTEFNSKGIIEKVYMQALSTLENHVPVAALFFSTYGLDITNTVKHLNALLPENCTLLGASSNGEVSNELGYAHNSYLLILFATDKIKIYTGIVTELFDDKDHNEAAITAAVSKASQGQNVKLALIFPDGLKLDGAQITQSFHNALGPNCGLFGGAAAERFDFVDTWQLYNDILYETAVPFMIFSGPIDYSYGMANSLAGGWKAIGPKQDIETEGTTVTKIGGKPALAFFNSRFKLKGGLLSTAHPLAVHVGDEMVSPILRDVLNYDEAAQTLTLFQELPDEPCWVQMTQPITAEILRSSRKACLDAISYFPSHQQPDALLWFSCIARTQLLDGVVGDEYQQVKAFNDHIPTAGFYVYGEIGPKDRQTDIKEVAYHSSALIVLAIGESATIVHNHTNGDDEYTLSLLNTEIERLNQENLNLQQQIVNLSDTKDSLGQLRADRTHQRKAIENQDAVIKALMSLLDENEGRLPRCVVKGSGKINKKGLAELLMQRVTNSESALTLGAIQKLL